jgi:chemotaxis protein CheD
MVIPAPSIPDLFAQRLIVGVGEMEVSNDAGMILSTYGLGSCLAVVAHDPLRKIGGMLHFMLPDSRIAPVKATDQPAMFADTGLPLLFAALQGLNADPATLKIYLAGGATVIGASDTFRIGERNLEAALDYLAGKGLAAHRLDVGGTVNRTVHLHLGTGEISLKLPHAIETFRIG